MKGILDTPTRARRQAAVALPIGVARSLVEVDLLSKLCVQKDLELLHLALVALCALVYRGDAGVETLLVLCDALQRGWYEEVDERLADFEPGWP